MSSPFLCRVKETITDLELQSKNIVHPKEMGAQFQTEARAGRISTAAGLREMLKQVRSSLEPVTNNKYSKTLSSDSNRYSLRRDSKGEVDMSVSKGAKADKPERPTLTSTGTSYRNVIRGKAGPVLYMQKDQGMSRIVAIHSGASQEYGHNADDDESTIVPQSVPILLMSGDGYMTTVEAESDSDKEYFEYTIEDVCSDDVSDCYTDVSDDDRSNNGRFEYPRESQKIALMRIHRCM